MTHTIELTSEQLLIIQSAFAYSDINNLFDKNPWIEEEGSLSYYDEQEEELRNWIEDEIEKTDYKTLYAQ